jgi:GNAT superfamily N-acetyltransferase
MNQLAQAPIPQLQIERLEDGEWQDIQRVLRESHSIWSSGMDKAAYYEYIWWQKHHPWSRRNYRFLLYRNRDGEVMSSMKLYTFEVVARHQRFKIGGVGAVYTLRRHRGHGFAERMLQAAGDMCWKDGYDAMLLYSDIGHDLYARLGYVPLGACEFYIFLKEAEGFEPTTGLRDSAWTESALLDSEPSFEVSTVDLKVVSPTVRYYQRWRDGLSFAPDRQEDYWHYRLSREQYVAAHRKNPDRPFEILAKKGTLSGESSEAGSGYLMFERSEEGILRVLEVVGAAEDKESLWKQILRLARRWDISIVRGWESSAPLSLHGVRFVERDWALPMILPFNEAVAKWQEPLPCPLLELDHF